MLETITKMVSKGPPIVTIGTLKIYDFGELGRLANANLREAMTNERSKRWNKVIQNYRQLIRLLDKNNFPRDMPIPSWYCMLMYETHYHLGIALQHVDEHKRAVVQYTKAIESVFIPKNGCLAGCNSNTCLMTPLYAKRSFAYAKSGDWKNALKDAEKSVMLDNKNPDVYCIRAMVRSTRNEIALALEDVRRALRYNPNHLCALIIKGRLAAPAEHDEWLEPGKKTVNLDHKKACSINPDCHNFLAVQDFKHPNIQAFYERFLYSLSIPHTVAEILFAYRRGQGQSQGQGQDQGQGQAGYSRVSSAKSTESRTSITNQSKINQQNSSTTIHGFSSDGWTKPFRCGTPAGQIPKENDDKIVQRRKEYSDAVRDHLARPKTAEGAVAYHEKQRKKRQFAEARAARLKPSSSCEAFSSQTKSRSINKMTRTSATEISSPTPEYIPKKNISVFQEMNIKEMPRMYYRPWLGDKLPVADLDKKQWITPPFKV